MFNLVKVALLKTRQEAVVIALRATAPEMRCDYDRKVLLSVADNMERELGRKVQQS